MTSILRVFSAAQQRPAGARSCLGTGGHRRAPQSPALGGLRRKAGLPEEGADAAEQAPSQPWVVRKWSATQGTSSGPHAHTARKPSASGGRAPDPGHTPGWAVPHGGRSRQENTDCLAERDCGDRQGQRGPAWGWGGAQAVSEVGACWQLTTHCSSTELQRSWRPFSP